MRHTVLIVDDLASERRVAGAILEKTGAFRIRNAPSGEEAIRQISEELPDLVVTDLVMPGMDGLELVCRCRSLFPAVPVILITAHGNEELALVALEEGAASYVPKPQRQEWLEETVRRVLARSDADRQWRRLIRSINEFGCQLSLENDPALVARFVDYVQEVFPAAHLWDVAERVRMGTAIEEALLDALYHGNLEISEAELREARRDGSGRRLAHLVDQRRKNSKFQQRQIHVAVQLSGAGLRMSIRSEGPAFAPLEAASSNWTERFDEGRHHGMTVVQAIMDEVRFEGDGTEVTLIKLPTRVAKEVSQRIAQQRSGPGNQRNLLATLLSELDSAE